MAVSPTYPGVYVEEIPSGVRTIVGVGTSTALFIGRAKEGPLNVPTRIFSPNDFQRIFSNDTSQGDMPRAVRLFYSNGGAQAWVMRIASGASAASIQLMNEPGVSPSTPVLQVTAKSAGYFGNNIRIAITYNAQDPEGSFDLRVFDWQTNSRGQLVQADTEYYPRLSMDPNDNAYAPLVVNNSSALIQLTDIAPPIAGNGTSRAGRLLPNSATGLAAVLPGLFGAGATLMVSVDGKPPVAVDLSAVGALTAAADVATTINTSINNNLSGGSTVVVSPVPGPTGTGDYATTFYLQIGSANGDVRVTPASAGDLAVPLMFGAAQGGIEIPRSSVRRPAPTGTCLLPTLNNLRTFGSLQQTAIANININGKSIDNVNIGGVATSLTIALNTVLTAGSRMFQDAIPFSRTGNVDGIREKLGLLATAINQAAAADPKFTWSAAVVGHRLVLTPTNGPDNAQPTITSNVGTFASSFQTNARFYNLGLTTGGPFQQAGPTVAADGTAPQLTDFAAAYLQIDKYVDLFNLMVLPRDVQDTDTTVSQRAGPASVFCQKRRALLLLDAPTGWSTVDQALDPTTGVNSVRIGVVKDTAALFFPRLQIAEVGGTVYTGSSGAMAGVMARIDATRGVWKAPAGTEADFRDIVGLKERLSDDEHGALNPRAINVGRAFPDGIVSWGARTMDGDDDFASEYKYIPVRRFAYFLEESLVRGLKWVVFEPNAEPLWAQIRLNVGAFMQEQFRKGAFAGTTPTTSYFVKCDASTTTAADQDLGVVNVIVGFAPLEPAEFVVIQLQQMAGQLAT